LGKFLKRLNLAELKINRWQPTILLNSHFSKQSHSLSQRALTMWFLKTTKIMLQKSQAGRVGKKYLCAMHACDKHEKVKVANVI
jgi:hypothetical protein